jgi:general secretion pathway protein D
MRKSMRRLFTFLLIFSLTLAASGATEKATTPQPVATPVPAAKPADTTGGRLWNLQDADILSVINEVSLETGKNFVVDPRVSGKISLISSKPLKPEQVYDVFLSVLGLLGYSAVSSGDVVKIIPNMESSEYATRIADSRAPGKGDEVVVRVIPLENVSANQIIPIVRPMLPQWSNVSSYAPGNVIILLGRAGNLNRIIDVIRRVDRASNSTIDVIPLHRASASQVATVLNNLQNAGRASGDVPQVTVAADERTNSILLGGNQAARVHTKYLISQLDTPSAGAQGNTEVIYLKYLKAKSFAPILGKIAQNMMGKDDPSTAAATASTATSKTKTPENLTSIQGEPSTNSIIITAPPSVLSALRVIVTKLDIRPAQVLVEGIIVQIDQDDLKNLGIQWGTFLGDNANVANAVTASASNGSTFGASNSVSFPPLGAGTFGIIPGAQIRAVLSALQSKTGVNILSTPSIVVLDNHKATLSVGQDIPEQSGTYATTGSSSTVTPFNTISRKPVVLKLDVIPQINLSNSVRLSIAVSNDTLQNPDNPGLNPIINTSKIINSVIVNSEDILVLGGLISNTLTESNDKVPILGDIPLLGYAFQHSVRKFEKKNLVIFIKPIILHSAEDAENITYPKYNMTRNLQINQTEALSHQPNNPRVDNVLPLWKNNVALPKPFELQ